jgi:hypothetical protein
MHTFNLRIQYVLLWSLEISTVRSHVSMRRIASWCEKIDKKRVGVIHKIRLHIRLTLFSTLDPEFAAIL